MNPPQTPDQAIKSSVTTPPPLKRGNKPPVIQDLFPKLEMDDNDQVTASQAFAEIDGSAIDGPASDGSTSDGPASPVAKRVKLMR